MAHQTGSVLFNLSPANTEGKFPGKSGATELLHMVFAVASEPNMAPAVIYIDEVDRILANLGKKKSVSEGPARFKKDLGTYINSLTPVCCMHTHQCPELAKLTTTGPNRNRRRVSL